MKLVIKCHGGSDIPSAAQALLSEELFTWTEYDVWNNHEFTVEWRIETHAYPEKVLIAGKNRFLEQGNLTLVESRGDLRIDLSAIPGLPPLLLSRLVHLVEAQVAKKIEPNLMQMGQNVQMYLEQTQTSQ